MVDTTVFTAFFLFGLGSWVLINGMFAQLNIFVQELPEKWSIASVLSFATQLANVFPLAFVAYVQLAKRRSRRLQIPPVDNNMVIACLIAVGVVVSILIAYLWNLTSVVFGTSQSTSLIVLCFFAGAMNCMTSVTYLPFLHGYDSRYTSPFTAGEGVGGLLASVLASIQLWNGPPPQAQPIFSVTVYFWLLAVVMLVSGAAFAFLVLHPRGRAAKAAAVLNAAAITDDDEAPTLPPSTAAAAVAAAATTTEGAVASAAEGETRVLLDADTAREGAFAAASTAKLAPELLRHLRVIYALTFGLNFVENGMMFSILPYATLNYTSGSLVFELSLLLALIADPLACLVAFFYQLNRYRYHILVPASGAITLFVLYLALASPHPPLAGSAAMAVFVVVLNVLNRAFMAYMKTLLYWDVKVSLKGAAAALSPQQLQQHGETVFRWVGVATQLGSLSGSVTFFLLINVLGVFRHS